MELVVNETEDFNGMDFNFSNANQVEVSRNDDPVETGVWRVLRGDGDNLQVYLNFGVNDPLLQNPSF